MLYLFLRLYHDDALNNPYFFQIYSLIFSNIAVKNHINAEEQAVEKVKAGQAAEKPREEKPTEAPKADEQLAEKPPEETTTEAPEADVREQARPGGVRVMQGSLRGRIVRFSCLVIF